MADDRQVFGRRSSAVPQTNVADCHGRRRAPGSNAGRAFSGRRDTVARHQIAKPGPACIGDAEKLVEEQRVAIGTAGVEPVVAASLQLVVERPAGLRPGRRRRGARDHAALEISGQAVVDMFASIPARLRRF